MSGGSGGAAHARGLGGVPPASNLGGGADKGDSLKDAERGDVYSIALAWLRISEPARDPLTEADLSLIWQGQRFPPEALTTADGRAVEVVFPGRRGGAAGPDFRDAVVRLDGVERRGDVELHVRASAFRAHGHHIDPAYTRLALHVVYRADEPETRLANGAATPVAAFAPWLEGRSAELESWLQAPEMWREPCRDAPERLGENAMREALERAGLRRFEARTERLREAIGQIGEEEALWRALLDTLGVGGDRAGFRRFAEAFPASLVSETRDLERALVHVAGLDPDPPKQDVGLPEPLRPSLQAHGRPSNHPRLRLTGLAAILERADGQSGRLADGYSGLANEQTGRRPLGEMAVGSVGTAESAKALLSLWCAPPGIGQGRALELLVNAVLPFAASRGRHEKAVTLLRRLPAAASYGKTAFLESNLRPARGRIARSALQSQGMLAYVAEWCSQGGCGRCPLSR